MVDNLIIEAYALTKAGLWCEDKLEQYLCKELGLPDFYFSEKYNEITKQANKAAKCDQAYRQNIYNEYIKLIKECENKWQPLIN